MRRSPPGDLTDPASLNRALTGVTHVVTTANAFTVRVRAAVKRVDLLGNRNLIDAAKRAGGTAVRLHIGLAA